MNVCVQVKRFHPFIQSTNHKYQGSLQILGYYSYGRCSLKYNENQLLYDYELKD